MNIINILQTSKMKPKQTVRNKKLSKVNIMTSLILFPSSYYSVAQIDEAFLAELTTVNGIGLFDTILFGYDQWINDGKLLLSKTPTLPRSAVMRGWMMKPETYKMFYEELLKNNIHLVTSPEEYELMHVFPNIYKFFGSDTAAMKLYALHQHIDVNELKESFNRFMVKDYVKSVKGTDFPRFFDSSITQDKFDDWMKLFYEYRGSLLTGGICVKEYLNLMLYEGKPNEFRVFYVNNEILTISRNSGQGRYTPEPPRQLIEKYKNLQSCYYTVDYAELADGSWKVIEAGDGSVSGLSDGQNATFYFRTLYHAFNK